jgi:transposase
MLCGVHWAIVFAAIRCRDRRRSSFRLSAACAMSTTGRFVCALRAGTPTSESTMRRPALRISELKKQERTKWLNDVSSVPIQQSFRHLQSAFVRFREKTAKYPPFKQKDGKQSAESTRSVFQWDAQMRFTGNRMLIFTNKSTLFITSRNKNFKTNCYNGYNRDLDR